MKDVRGGGSKKNILVRSLVRVDDQACGGGHKVISEILTIELRFRNPWELCSVCCSNMLV
jgi:hypothetical protein